MHTVIIGNGIAGITCARHLRKHSDERITVISGETPHFFSRTALMYIFMGHMRYEHTKPYEDWFWHKNRIELKHAWVESLQAEASCIVLEGGIRMHYDRLVIATGSCSRKGGWAGESFKGVHTLYSLQDLQALEEATQSLIESVNSPRRAIVVGGGLIGVELCEMFRSRGLEVIMLVREGHFWGNVLSKEEGKLVEAQIQGHGVRVLCHKELDVILGNDEGMLTSVRLNTGERIHCSLLAVSIGVEPNVSWLADSGIDIGRGVRIDRKFRSNLDKVYAIGDCAEFREPPPGVAPLNQVWYTGRMMGETLSYILLGKDLEYRPGPWFNSAKFFDLEYQTYGAVSPIKKQDETHFIWQNKIKNMSIKVVFDINGFKFLGINTIGIRISHEKMSSYLARECTILEVLSRLKEWVFDPEFTAGFQKEFVSEWNANFPHLEVTIKRRTRWF